MDRNVGPTIWCGVKWGVDQILTSTWRTLFEGKCHVLVRLVIRNVGIFLETSDENAKMGYPSHRHSDFPWCCHCFEPRCEVIPRSTDPHSSSLYQTYFVRNCPKYDDRWETKTRHTKTVTISRFSGQILEISEYIFKFNSGIVLRHNLHPHGGLDVFPRTLRVYPLGYPNT